MYNVGYLCAETVACHRNPRRYFGFWMYGCASTVLWFFFLSNCSLFLIPKYLLFCGYCLKQYPQKSKYFKIEYTRFQCFGFETHHTVHTIDINWNREIAHIVILIWPKRNNSITKCAAWYIVHKLDKKFDYLEIDCYLFSIVHGVLCNLFGVVKNILYDLFPLIQSCLK